MNTEKLYQEFTTKMLPQIQEGLTITKDYFIDLFGRYVQFLIFESAVWLALSLVVFIASVWFGIKVTKKIWSNFKETGDDDALIIPILFLVPISFSSYGVIHYTIDIAKAIYVPEVRVYEELQDYRNNQ